MSGNIVEKEDDRHLIEATKNKFVRLNLLVKQRWYCPKVRADILDATEEASMKCFARVFAGLTS